MNLNEDEDILPSVYIDFEDQLDNDQIDAHEEAFIRGYEDY